MDTSPPATRDATPGSAPVSRTDLLDLYRRMRLIRRFEETVLDLLGGEQPEIEGPVHLYLGQEAVAAGVCQALTRADKIVSTHRGHGHCIAKGADTARMMAELFGRATGYCRGRGGSMHIADFDIGVLGANGIVAAGLPIATGAALAESMSGSSQVVAVMFGDGAAAAGPMHESLNIAALWKLPLLFVCENNGWSVNSEPADVLAAAAVADLAAPYGIPSRVLDGNDVLDVADGAAWAVDRARRGLGPAFLEARTYRVGAHAIRGAVPPDGRDPDTVAGWLARDPVAAHARHLVEYQVADDAAVAEMDRSVEQELIEAVGFARRSPFPEPGEALEGVFAA